MNTARLRQFTIAAIMIVAFALMVMPAPAGIAPSVLHVGGLAAFAIGAFVFGVLPEYVTVIAFFLLAVALNIAPPAVVFAGFHSTAWWLVFGGLIVGIAVQRTGLGKRIATVLFGRMAGSYAGAVTAVVVVAVGLAFLMPSTMGRLVLLTPIVLSLADHLGFAPGSNGRTGLVVATATAGYMPSCAILPANVPNSVLLGAADTLYGIKLTYGPYLLLHFPILGLLKSVILIWVVCRMFPDTPRAAERAAALVPMSKDERRLAGLLAVSLLLFATDFLHGVSPAWVSLAAGLVCLLPGVDLVPPKTFAEKLNFSALLYVAGILGLGAVVSESGLGQALSTMLLNVFQPVPGADAFDFTVLLGLSMLLGAVTTMPGLPAVLTPLAGDMAAASGLPLLSVLMLQVLAFSTVFLPYQSAPMVVGMQIGGVDMRAGTRICLALAAITLVVLLPLDYFWWCLLGYIG